MFVDKENTDLLDVSVETKKGLERCMTVRVPLVEIDQEVDARLIKVGKTARLKGFRPGKIPPKVVRQHYGEQVHQEVMTDKIRSTFIRALGQEELNPAGGPSIEALPTKDEDAFVSYKATFEVYPDLTLNPMEKITVETLKVDIQDSDVDEMLEKLRDQQAEWQEVDRKSQAGDRVVIDFLGKVNDEPFEGGEGKEVPVVVGEGHVIKDFDKALKGIAAGQDKVAKVKFPKDYPSENLAGENASFDITVHRVEKKILPEVNQDFVKLMGVEDGDLDTLKNKLLENMTRELNQRLEAEAKNQALGALLKANKVEVPNALVEEETSTLQAEAMQRLGVQDSEKAPPKSEFSEAAKKRVAVSLLVQELIKENQIELDQKRVDERINEFVSRYEKPEEAASMYRSNKELMTRMESGVLEDQVTDFILDKAKIKAKVKSFKEFMG